MPLYLLDTNALSRLARGIDKALSDKISRHVDDCVLSAVAWYKLEYGAARSPDPVKSGQRLPLRRAIFPKKWLLSRSAASNSFLARSISTTRSENRYELPPLGHCFSPR